MQYIFFLLGAFLPHLAFASITNFFEAQILFFDLVNRAAYLLLAAGFAFFVFGVVKFIANADDTAAREQGKKYMVYAIVSLAVLVSIWSIVGILLGTFDIKIGTTPGFVSD